SYFRGTSAEQFDLLSQDQQILEIHNRWRSVFPNLEDYILNNFSFSWAKEPWSGSGYASPTEAQETSLKSHLSAVEGRIHFAGDHTSEFPGWIQGALESGIRAAREIHAIG
ncbi:MAG: L-amino-acid oxidase, partial [Gammaproteobacteria bacterium]|nr:L-amino-acid oxidase [Gammaproteobacteria bacterium]